MRRRAVWNGPALGSVARVMPPWGPGMEAERTALATHLEQWESDWADAVDYTEWRLYQGDMLVQTRRVEGY